MPNSAVMTDGSSFYVANLTCSSQLAEQADGTIAVTLQQLLLEVESCAAHPHCCGGVTTITRPDTEATVAEPQEWPCQYLALLQQLCHWIAARSLPPPPVSDAVSLARRTQPRGLHVEDSLPPCGCGSEERSSSLEKQSVSGAASPPTVHVSHASITVACLLPPHTCMRLADDLELDVSASRKTHHVTVQRAVERCFDLLRAASRSSEASEAGISTRVATLYHLWRTLSARSDSFSHRPVLRTQGVASLLRVYATAGTELAAQALVSVLRAPPSSLPPPSGPHSLRVASLSFYKLLECQHAARSAVQFVASAECDTLIKERIAPLLSMLTRPCPARGAAAAFLHPAVELSVRALETVAGCGLVTRSDIAEGELLAQETSLMVLPPQPWCSQQGEDNRDGYSQWLAKGLAASLSDACDGDGTAPAMDREDRGPLASSGHPDSAAQFLVEHAAALAGHGAATWWFPWAVALSAARMPPSPSAPPAVPAKNVKEAIQDILLGAATAASARSHAENKEHSFRDGAMRTAPHTVPFSFVTARELDELHLPRPLSPMFPKRHSPGTHGCDDGARQGHAGQLIVEPCAVLCCMLGFVNHACAPNAALVFETHTDRTGAQRVLGSLVALRDLEVGEEVTVSYVPTTTALTVSQTELTALLGFACRCRLCTEKAALLHGVVCAECTQLVVAPRLTGTDVASAAPPSSFSHAPHCSRHRQGSGGGTRATSDATGNSGISDRNGVAAQLRRQLDRVSADVADAVPPSPLCSSSPPPPDAAAKAVRDLVALDECVACTLLPTHHLRLRLRLEAFAYASAAYALGSTASAAVIGLCASTLESLEVLLPASHPLLTGLRMYLVFSRGRHLSAVSAADAVEAGRRHSDCCGAVREQAALMALPFVLDPLVRQCVARCFQDHYVQLLGWRLPRLATEVTEEEVLRSFLTRFPVELEAAGITAVEHVELLSCMEEGTEAATQGGV